MSSGSVPGVNCNDQFTEILMTSFRKVLIGGGVALVAAVTVTVGAFAGSQLPSDGSSFHRATAPRVSHESPSVSPSAPASPIVPSEPAPVPSSEPPVEPEPAQPAPVPVEIPESDPVVEFYPTLGLFDQAAVDRGGVVTWSINPLILAAHNIAGWYWIDDLSIGTKVYIGSGPGVGNYVVVGHYRLPGKVHYVEDVPPGYDGYLQTCEDDEGVNALGFSLLQRV